jgi:hypothetical protein
MLCDPSYWGISVNNKARQDSLRELTQLYALQMASGRILPILKDALVEPNLVQHPLRTWLFVIEIHLIRNASG